MMMHVASFEKKKYETPDALGFALHLCFSLAFSKVKLRKGRKIQRKRERESERERRYERAPSVGPLVMLAKKSGQVATSFSFSATRR